MLTLTSLTREGSTAVLAYLVRSQPAPALRSVAGFVLVLSHKRTTPDGAAVADGGPLVSRT